MTATPASPARPRPRARPLLALAAVLAGLVAPPATAAPDGTLDPTFNGDGVLGPISGHQARAAAVLPNQDVAVVGELLITPEPLVDVFRAFADGSGGTDCGQGIFSLASFTGLAVLADRGGKLVIGGVATFSGAPSQEVALIARFGGASLCTFDSGWSGAGWEALDDESFCDPEDCLLVDLAEAPTATPRLFALVESRVNLFVSRYFVVAFEADGNVDGSFGTGGYAEVSAAGLGSLAAGGAHLAVDPLGRPLVLAARYDPDVGLDADPFVARFEGDGDLDPTFAGGGIHILSDHEDVDEFGADIVVGAAGWIYAGVYDISTGNGLSWLYGKAPQGPSWTTLGSANRRLAAIAAQGDARAVTVSDLLDEDSLEVRRLIERSLPSLGWTPDDSFGTANGAGKFDVDLGGGNGQQAVALVLSAGRPVLVANAETTGGGEALVLIGLRNRHLFVDGFELGSMARWQWRPGPAPALEQ
jgi:hypothetical protein